MGTIRTKKPPLSKQKPNTLNQKKISNFSLFLKKSKRKILVGGLAFGLAASSLAIKENIRTRQALTEKQRIEKQHTSRPKPRIHFMYSQHGINTFNFLEYLKMIETASREGHPYNTIVLESYAMPKERKDFLEKDIAKNINRIIDLSKRLAYFTPKNPQTVEQASVMFTELVGLLHEVDNPVAARAAVYAFAHGAKHFRYAESYSPQEIQMLGNRILFSRDPLAKLKYPDWNIVSDPLEYIKFNAWKLKMRNRRMAQTLLGLEKEFSKTNSQEQLNAIVIAGGAHGGLRAKTGIQRELFGNTSAEIMLGGDRDKINEQILSPKTLGDLIERESMFLAEKSLKEINEYSKETFMRRVKAHGIKYP